MADEVTDPIEELARAHTKRMQEIAAEGFETSKQLCDDTVTTVRRNAGFKSGILDRALDVLGIETGGRP